MLTLDNRNVLKFSAPNVHPQAELSINLQRTLRIPDDGKDYPLPPGLGSFPLKHVDDFLDRVPAKWRERGGVMMPMYQSEALWLRFSTTSIYNQGSYPFAIKVSAGKVSAVTGEVWTSGLTKKDYLVVPAQPWLDGYVVEDGLVRQFVAAPLGGGFTAEEQITGEAAHGGIQIEVYPMKREAFERRFPQQRRDPTRRRRISEVCEGSHFSTDFMELDYERSIALNLDMGLAAGGTMKQQIFEDPYSFEDWDTENGTRVFVHIANSLVWKAITKYDPPHPPATAADYTNRGLPWFDYYSEDKTLLGTEKLKGLKSIMKLGFQKGVPMLPENTSATFKSDQVKSVGPQKRPDEVRQGSW